MNPFIFHLSGLTCPACVKLSEKKLKKIEGVTSVNVNLETGLAEVYSDKEITKESILFALDGSDYKVKF